MKPLLLAACLLPLTSFPTSAQEDLDELALSLVNEARADEGLQALEQDALLTEAAEGHAEDMLERGYYDHVSPEGATAQDRVIEAGGSRWSIVAENLATCEGCETPIRPEQIREFQTGWMQSPEHRKNILQGGLDRFGFGLASEDGTAYAVQMFAGPGTSPALSNGNVGEQVAADVLRDNALKAVNAARADASQAKLEMSQALNQAAATAIDQATVNDGALQLPTDLFELLPESSSGWTALSIAAKACGGCGAFPVEADAAYFMERLRPGEGAADFTHIGFAFAADGSGRKLAAAVYGRRAEAREAE